MKRLILGSLSLLLISTTTLPDARAQIATPGTSSNSVANPFEDSGNRLDPDRPGTSSISNGRTVPGTPSNSDAIHCGWRAQRLLGTPSHAAANPAADPGSRLDTTTPGAPNVSGRHRFKKNC